MALNATVDLDDPVEVAKALTSFINRSSGAEQDDFVDQVTYRTHRTLQQGTMRLLMALVHRWASQYEAGNYDARNEQCCKLAHLITQNVEDIERYLPLI